MIAGQAIGNIVANRMDLTSISSSAESGIAKSSDSISFDKLLTKSYNNQTQNQAENQIVDSKSQSNSKGNNVDVANNNTNKVQNNPKDIQSSQTVTNEKDKLSDVAKVVEEAKEIVKKELDLTEEELLSAMEMLGLTMIDLLNPDKLLQLTLECTGVEDASMLLTDHSLGLQLANIVKDITNVMQENNISSEDIQRIADDETEFANLMELLSSTPEETLTSDNAVTSTKANDLVEEVNKDTTDSEIEFTVVKETDTFETKLNSSKDANSDSSEQGKGSQEKTQIVTQFIEQIANAGVSTTQEANFSEQLSEIHQLQDIANQIIDAVKVTIKPNQTSMEFSLNPENLGRIALSITSKEGVITAFFVAQNQLTKEAIESQMQVLKENLTNQGVKVEAIEVTISEFAFSQSNEMNQGKNDQNSASSNTKRAFRADLGSISVEEEEALEVEHLDSGSQIDYSA